MERLIQKWTCPQIPILLKVSHGLDMFLFIVLNPILCWWRRLGFRRFMRFHLGVIKLAQSCPYAIFKPENKYCNHSQAGIALVAFY